MKLRFYAIVAVITLALPCEGHAGEPDVAEILIVGPQGRTETVQTPVDSELLYLTKTLPQIERIEGLGQLQKLRFLSIGFSDLSHTDFSFLLEVSESLTTLRLVFATLPDAIDFLALAPNLKAFSSQETYEIPNGLQIDLKGSNLLEFFEIAGGSTSSNPRIANPPSTLQAVSFYSVDFGELSFDRWSNLIEQDIDIYLLEYQYEDVELVPANVLRARRWSDLQDRYGL